MDNGELYKNRIERQKREEAERQAAIKRDTPYDSNDMQSRMPLACGVIVATLFAGAIVAVFWLLMKLFMGG